MTPFPILRTALICAALALPHAAAAQEEAAPETEMLPVEPMMTGNGEPFVAATHRDWQILCNRFGEGEQEQEVCEMYKLLETDDGPIAELSIAALPEGSQFPAGMTVTTPLETFLPAGVVVRIDSGQPRQEPFLVCMVIGCIARIGLDESEVSAMQRGVNAFVTIASIAAADQPIELPVSLLGFTAALEDLRARQQ